MNAVEAIERATLAAVPPQAIGEEDGWLLGLDDGTVGRAHSAVPLAHEAPRDGLLPAIEARYAARSLRPVFRIPRVPCFDAARAALQARGYRAATPTLTQTGGIHGMARLAGAAAQVALTPAPVDGWAGVFLGEGFDPVDGASRLAILGRTRGSVFATVRAGGEVAAVGSACFSHGWMGVHGMRTAPAQRGKGLASAILTAFAHEALARGITQVFLQVDASNTGAQALYARAGLGTAWAYDYWRR